MVKSKRFGSYEFRVVNRNPFVVSSNGIYAIRVFNQKRYQFFCKDCPFNNGLGCRVTYWKRNVGNLMNLACICVFGLSREDEKIQSLGMVGFKNMLFLKEEEEV